MKLRYIFYIEEELNQSGALAKAIQKLRKEAVRRGIKLKSLETDCISKGLNQAGALPEESLIITSQKRTLEQIRDLSMASVGYASDGYGEDLYQADLLAEGFDEVDTDFLERVYQRKHAIPWRVIETKRCYLREMMLEDLDDLYEMYAGAGMTEYMEPLYEREEEEAYTSAYIKNMYGFYGFGMWLVKDRSTDALIGRAGLNIMEGEKEHILEMGYAIAVPYQRKGYAKEVCKSIMEYAKTLEYECLCCFIHPHNAASKGLLRQLGFIDRGTADREGVEMVKYEWRMENE